MTPSGGLFAFSLHPFLLLADQINLLEYSLYVINFFCPLPSGLDTFQLPARASAAPAGVQEDEAEAPLLSPECRLKYTHLCARTFL